MPNKNYTRSRAKEQAMVNFYKNLGWFSTRTPGSKTPVDVLAIRPAQCGNDIHYEVHFHQFKVSENRVSEKDEVVKENIPFLAPILWHFLPVKSKKWLAGRKVQRDKKKAKLKKSRSQ